MARKRAQQRWSALLTRIAKQVHPALGDMLWDKFVAHAEGQYKDKFTAAAALCRAASWWVVSAQIRSGPDVAACVPDARRAAPRP